MTRFTFTDEAGMHFSKAMCQDVLDFIHAAMQRDNAKSRDVLLFDLNSPPGQPQTSSIGTEFDEKLSKLCAHFGLTFSRKEPKAKKAGRRA